MTPDDDYVFLEINEMGAFLWIEGQNPEFLLIDAFSEFLIQATPAFDWTPTANSIRLEDVEKDALQQMREAAQIHQAATMDTLVDDAEN